MNTPLGQLLKLEWHERKWAFALGLAWVALTVVYAVLADLRFAFLRMPIGLMAVVVCLDLLPMLLRSMIQYGSITLIGFAETIVFDQSRYVLCIPLLHAAAYSLPVMAICTWRRPMLAAVAALGFLALGYYAPLVHGSLREFHPLQMMVQLNNANQPHWGSLPRSYWLDYGTLAAVNVVAACQAWRAVAR